MYPLRGRNFDFIAVPVCSPRWGPCTLGTWLRQDACEQGRVTSLTVSGYVWTAPSGEPTRVQLRQLVWPVSWSVSLSNGFSQTDLQETYPVPIRQSAPKPGVRSHRDAQRFLSSITLLRQLHLLSYAPRISVFMLHGTLLNSESSNEVWRSQTFELRGSTATACPCAITNSMRSGLSAFVLLRTACKSFPFLSFALPRPESVLGPMPNTYALVPALNHHHQHYFTVSTNSHNNTTVTASCHWREGCASSGGPPLT